MLVFVTLVCVMFMLSHPETIAQRPTTRVGRAPGPLPPFLFSERLGQFPDLWNNNNNDNNNDNNNTIATTNNDNDDNNATN